MQVLSFIHLHIYIQYIYLNVVGICMVSSTPRRVGPVQIACLSSSTKTRHCEGNSHQLHLLKAKHTLLDSNDIPTWLLWHPSSILSVLCTHAVGRTGLQCMLFWLVYPCRCKSVFRIVYVCTHDVESVKHILRVGQLLMWYDPDVTIFKSIEKLNHVGQALISRS